MLALVGCRDGKTTADSYFAVGWEGELRSPLFLNDCVGAGRGSPALFEPDPTGWMRATAVGDVALRCGEKGVWHVHVREAARYQVNAPTSLTAGDRSSASLEGFDADGNRLSLGVHADVTWKLDGSVREADRLPHDFIGPALERLGSFPSISIEGTATGPATITATHLRGRPIDARATLTVTAAPSPPR